MKSFILIIILSFVLFPFVRLYNYAQKGRQLSKESKPFSYSTTDSSNNLLIIGDSTAVGTGANDPSNSIAGMFHNDYPGWNIKNKAEDGARLKEAIEQLKSTDNYFDIILIQVGANDTLHFTPLKKVKYRLEDLLSKAKEKSDSVIYLAHGNLGAAPIFGWPFNILFDYRSQKYLEVYEDIANKMNVSFVNLYYSKDVDPFLKDVDRFYADDMLHLSKHGYRNWYEKIKQK